MSLEEEYEAMVGDEEGLTKLQAYDALCNVGQNPTGLEIIDFMKKHGKEEDDLINLEEMKELNESLGDPEQKLRDAFAQFDDGDGFVSEEELKQILAEADIWGSGIHSDEDFWQSYWETTLKDGDLNQDGRLSIDELIKLVQKGAVTI